MSTRETFSRANEPRKGDIIIRQTAKRPDDRMCDFLEGFLGEETKKIGERHREGAEGDGEGPLFHIMRPFIRFSAAPFGAVVRSKPRMANSWRSR